MKKKVKNIEEAKSEPLLQTAVSSRFFLRVLLSPFIFIWGVFLLMVLTLFPLPFLVIGSFLGLLLEPLVFLLRKSGAKINGIEPFFNETKYNFLNHFMGFTIYIWGAFAVAYIYIKSGKIINS